LRQLSKPIIIERIPAPNPKPWFIPRVMIACLFVLLAHLMLNAQPLKKFNSKAYGVNEGLLSGHVLDMMEDGNGFLWISTGVGLQRFDGNTFETIAVQDGLPQTTRLSFFKLDNGNIWLCYEDGISAYNMATNKFKKIIRRAKKVDQPKEGLPTAYPSIMPVLETAAGVWCRDRVKKRFICINKISGRVIDSLLVPANMEPGNSTFIKGYDNTLLYNATSYALVEIDFNTKKIINVYRGTTGNQSISFYRAINKTDIIFLGYTGLYRVNMESGSTTLLSRYPTLSAKHIYNKSLTPLHNGLFVLSLNNELFTIDAVSGKVLYKIVNQQNGLFVDPGYISDCIVDRYDHLWVISAAEGLKKVNLNNLGIKYYGFGRPAQNFNRCIYADKASNLIITGSLFNGFSVFDTSQRLIRHFRLAPEEQTSCILKIKPAAYLLFTNQKPWVYALDAKKMQLTALPGSITAAFKNSDVLYETYLQHLTDSTAVLFCNFSYVIVHFSKGKVQFTRVAQQKEFSGAILDKRQRIWLGQTGKYLISGPGRPGGETAFSLPEKVKIQCFFEDNENNMWVGTEKGLYQVNAGTGAIIHSYQKKEGLANDCIYSIVYDDKGTLWCGTNKGISGIYRSGKIINIHSSDGLQADEFNTNSFAKDADGELFFGGINGVNSFYPDRIQKIAQQPQILMTNIKVTDANWKSDTALFNVQKITLPYSENILSFTFTALGWYTPDVYTYQYKMDGIDKDWVNAGNSGYARYALQPGKYTFEYTAGSEPSGNLPYKKTISITITPPFWRTLWFGVLMVACAILVVTAGLNSYYKTVNKKRLRLMEVQQTLQQERERISRDLHDNIGAYTTVLMASVEKLNNEAGQSGFQKTAQIVSENAKYIMASLKETIWVLNSDAITVTDMIDRFKLYANKIGHNFPDVQIRYKETLKENWAFSPAEGLHLFRIMQEAFQNALKHGRAKNITIFVYSDHALHISIADDGVGFNTSSHNTGNGLLNIKHRANEAGYNLTITSTGLGTEIALKKNNAFAV
jgi:signal transduction histidine kinase